jgi:8-oxo-dGTP pyrophosphatase MutT (NUDIX family)
MIFDIKSKVTKYNREILPETPKIASVLFPLIYSDEGLSILLTKRSSNLPNHSGEISFPGGMKDEKDISLEFTALRETEEEIGIKHNIIDLAGVLDDEISQAGHRVTPFLGFINEKYNDLKFKINKNEVEYILCVPLDFFCNEKTHWQETWIRKNEKRRVYFYLYEDKIIWGLTARMIYKFCEIIKFKEL